MRYFKHLNSDGEIDNLCSAEQAPEGWVEIPRTTWIMLRIAFRVEINGESIDDIADNQTWYDQPMI